MNPYIIGVIVLIILAAAGFGVYYYLRIHNRPRSMEHDYVWVGPGEHPFKGKKGKEED